MPTCPFWLGGVAASMAACFTHPLDLTKVRMQTLGPSVPRPSMLGTIRTSFLEEGLRGIYTGLSAALLRQMTYSLVRLGSYEEMKRCMSKDGQPSTGKLLLAAGAAGGLGGVAGNPADIVLVRMTSDSLRPPEQRYGYRNALSGLVCIVKNEGVKGLTRGLGTNTTRAVLMNASQVGSYDFFKATLLRHRIPFADYQFHDGVFLHIAASLAAGTCLFARRCFKNKDNELGEFLLPCIFNSVLMLPLKSENTSPLRVLVKSVREEGVMFMFKGWTPAFMRLGPNTILMFVFFEQLKRGWSYFADL
ncbi:mitochondrial carrier [Melanogaster broomeanus]|nr:mitochondrial carrier [Melanogaster broomeanus]